MEFFENISKSTMNLRMKFDLLNDFGILEITHGLDHHFGSHKNKKINKNDCPCNPLFCTVAYRWSIVFCLFIMIHNESECQNWTTNHFGPDEEFERFRLFKSGPQKLRNYDQMFGTFSQISQNLWRIDSWFLI